MGKGVYSQRGLTVHLQRSPVCQPFVTCSFSHPERQVMQGVLASRLDLSGAYTMDTGLNMSMGSSKPDTRPRLNPLDNWMNDCVIEEDVEFVNGGELDNDYMPLLDTSNVTYNHARAQTTACTNEAEADLLSEACLEEDTNHADPFAWEDTDESFASASLEQRCMVKLLKLLEDMECPDYALGNIIDWANEAYLAGFTFSPTVKSRDGVLGGLYKHVNNATLLLPSVVPVELIGTSGPSEMIVYDFVAQWLSLLHSKDLMRCHKVNIDPSDPFAMYEPPDGLLGEVHSGAMYRAMYAKYITDPHRQLLVPCMLYFDKCHITNGSGRFGLEPATMTSTIFTEHTRRSPEAHRVLGFIHQMMKSTAENTKQDSNVNVQNYHRQLDVLFTGLRRVQAGIDKRLQGVPITIYDDELNETTFTADIISPIILIIADTPAANILCGHYDNHNPKVQRHHHMCDTGFKELADWVKTCTFMDANHVFDIQANGTAMEQQALSVKQVKNAFRDLHVLLESSSILRATATEIMHSIRQGMIRRTNLLVFHCLGTEQLVSLDSMARKFHSQHRQSARRHFPRASFVKGITTLSKLSAEEQVGVTMTLVCLMLVIDCRSTAKG